MDVFIDCGNTVPENGKRPMLVYPNPSEGVMTLLRSHAGVSERMILTSLAA
jgi:hypothetical protein